MKKVKAYLCMQYRGENADRATEDEIQANIREAVATGSAIRIAFPETLNLYIPHEKQETTHRLWQKGYVTSEQILEVCCDIISEKDLLIVLGSMSSGMLVEIAHVSKEAKSVIKGDVFDDDMKERLGYAIAEIGKE